MDIDKPQLENVIGKAIRDASGKGFLQATKLITESVWALLEAYKPETFTITDQEPEPTSPPPQPIVPKATAPITSLRSVRPPRTAIVQQQHTTEFIQDLILKNTPEVLEFTPENTQNEAHLNRVLNVSNDTPPSVQISYRPNNAGPEVPYPKKILFSTDNLEDWNFPEIVDKMRRDAASMYRLRTQPITTTIVNMGGRVVIGRHEEV